jgi:putative spermidine/putrescine transport system substrate-binding protein
MRHSKAFGLTAIAASAVLLLSACSSSKSSSSATASGSRAAPPKESMLKTLGKGEGALNIIVWAGYAEDGSDDKTVDWVHPFEQATSCKVNAKVGNTSDEMVTLMKTGQYDGVSASGDATLRLIYGGDVAPVNTALVPNYATISTFLKDQPWNSVNGQMYGIPHGWGANVLMWNPTVVKTAPTSWSSVFDPSSPYKGKITAYDSPIYIADAALYLEKTQPNLKITNPYALDQTQFDAAISLLKAMKANWSRPWAAYTDEVQDFESGATAIGTAWQINANLINGDKKVAVDTTVPTEGATGWSDTWMVSSKAAHPNCMYEWMNWITSAETNAAVAQWFGEAPAQTKSCTIAAAGFCDQFHALDAAYASKISYWTTPTADCLDGRGNICVDYSKWTQAWTTIKG